MAMQFTNKANDALTQAAQSAAALGNPQLEASHLLDALLSQGKESIAVSVLNSIPIDTTSLLAATRKIVASLPKASGQSVSAPAPSAELNRVFSAAQEFARLRSDDYLSTEHLLIGIAKQGTTTKKLLTDAGVSEEALLDTFEKIRGDSRITSADP